MSTVEQGINLFGRLPPRPPPPKGQSLEYQRVIFRIDKDYEARNTESFLP